MGRFLVASVLAVVTLGTLAVSVPRSSPRQARWFLSRADVTEVVEEERMVTQATPWSCVVVAPSLPPCRHVRQLNIAATPPTPISATAAPGLARFYGDHNQVEASRRRYYLEQAMAPAGSMEAYHGDLVPVPTSPHGPHTGWVPLMSREATEPLPAAAAVPEAPAVPVPPPAPTAPPAPPTAQVPVKKREQGWAEWLGLRAYTVTTTVVKLATTKVVDPKTVVTFSVRGCQPSVLPFDLPLCVAQDPAQPETPAVEVSAAAPAAPPAETVAAEAAQAPAPAPAEKPPSMAPIVVAAAPPSQSAQSDKPVEKPAEESAEPNKA